MIFSTAVARKECKKDVLQFLVKLTAMIKKQVLTVTSNF